MNSNGSVGLSAFLAWGVVDGEAIAISVVMAEVQNLPANFSATVRNEGMVGGGQWVHPWVRQHCGHEESSWCRVQVFLGC